ncbi:MAG: recombinase family protein [Polyangiaceae bacterium]|nr:recombinase family protein [Polyangiaceae bacterium]
MIDDLTAIGIGFASVNEPFDTTTPSGKLLLSVVGAMAEFERAILVERTAPASMLLAVAVRASVGPASMSMSSTPFVLQREGKSYREIGIALGVGGSTVHRALQALGPPTQNRSRRRARWMPSNRRDQRRRARRLSLPVTFASGRPTVRTHARTHASTGTPRGPNRWLVEPFLQQAADQDQPLHFLVGERIRSAGVQDEHPAVELSVSIGHRPREPARGRVLPGIELLPGQLRFREEDAGGRRELGENFRDRPGSVLGSEWETTPVQ